MSFRDESARGILAVPAPGFILALLLLGCSGNVGEGRAGASGGRSGGRGQANAGGQGGSSEASGGAGAVPPPGASVAAGTTWRRLTSEQVKLAIDDIFGDGISMPALEPDARDHNFLSVGAASTTVSPAGVEKLQALAYAVADAVTADPARRGRWFTCDVSKDLDACLQQSLPQLALVLWHRPASADSLAGLRALASRVRENAGDPWKAVSFVLAAMLQSPRFYYVQERIDERASVAQGRVRLDDYSLASRLSLMLWNAPPDAELLAAAGDGKLADTAGMAQQVRQLLEKPQAMSGLRETLASAWGLHRARDRRFDEKIFPQVSEAYSVAAFEGAMKALAHHMIDQDRSLDEALLSNEVFVNRALAPVYGVKAADDAFVRVALPDGANRHGFFTHPAFLIANSTPDDTQPMLRGRTVIENLLCQEVPDPPPDLMAQLPPVPAGEKKTTRERLAAHRVDPFCAGCHDLLDPPGLAFENYDAAGFYRETEHGLPIDASGKLGDVSFEGPRGFVEALVETPDFRACLVENLLRHGTAHHATFANVDRSALAALYDQAGGQLDELLVRVTTNPMFTHAAVP